MQIQLTVQHEEGLHARPATLFVKTASSFNCDIKVRNSTKNSQTVDAKSIMGVLLIGVTQGDTIVIEACGEQAEQALAALKALVESNFKE